MRSISSSIAPASIPGMARRPVVRSWRFDLDGFLAVTWINACVSGFLRYQRQTKLLVHYCGKEAADRVLLPARRLHNGGDCCTLWLSEQGENGLLLGPAASRTRGNGPRPRGPGSRGSYARATSVFPEVLLCDIFRIPVGCDGTKRHRHRSPAVAPSPAGQGSLMGPPALISARRQ